MISTDNVARKITMNNRFFYGWMIVFIGALGIFFSGPGQTYSISVFIDSYIQDFGYSRSLVSSIYSTATLLSGIMLGFVGRFVDRYGQKHMSIAVAILLGVACIWNSFISNAVMLFIGFFMIRLLGQGSMTLLPNTLVPQWFIQKRGLALSLMSLGGVVASAVYPPLNTWLIQNLGWNHTWRIWAVLLWGIFVPIVFIFMKNKPEDMGLLPDHEKELKEEQSKKKSFIPEVSWTLGEAKRTRSFWLLLFCQSIPAMINTGLIFHFVSIVGEQGMSENFASFVLSIMAIVSFPTTFLAGFLADRLKTHWMIAGTFLGQIIAMGLLIMGHSPYMLIAFGVLRGIVGGFEAINGGVVWPNYFGRKYLGSIRGVVMTAIVIGSAFGPLPFGYAYDLFGGYFKIILFMMLFPGFGIVASLLSPPPTKQNA